MACFIVPLVLALFTTLFYRKFPEKFRIGWLNAMLWGGGLMLAVEHIVHREVVFYPPFLVGENILSDMISVGIPITVVCVSIWGGIVLTINRVSRNAEIGLKTKIKIMR